MGAQPTCPVGLAPLPDRRPPASGWEANSNLAIFPDPNIDRVTPKVGFPQGGACDLHNSQVVLGLFRAVAVEVGVGVQSWSLLATVAPHQTTVASKWFAQCTWGKCTAPVLENT